MIYDANIKYKKIAVTQIAINILYNCDLCDCYKVYKEKNSILLLFHRIRDNANTKKWHCPSFCVNRKLQDSGFILESCFQI